MILVCLDSALTGTAFRAGLAKMRASEASQKRHWRRREVDARPGGARPKRLPPWGTWTPGDGPATRQGRAERAIEIGMLESEARALLGQLEDYRANWPELAGDFERRNEAAIATARKLIGSADPHNHHQETT